MLKERIQEKLKNNPVLYRILQLPYRFFFYVFYAPCEGLLYKWYIKQCQKKFEKGEKFILTSFGGIPVKYEAFSAINLWHLFIGTKKENNFAKYVFEHVKEGMVVLDVGGYSGMFTIPLAKKVGPKGKVYCFEPEVKGVQAIERNIKLNEIQNAKVLKMAVSDIKGIIRFYVRPDKATHSIFNDTTAPSETGKQEAVDIQTSSIDVMVAEGLVEQPDFVKIDTEGAELKVLDGMKMAAAHIISVLVEIHHKELELSGISDPNQAVRDKLYALGFDTIEQMDYNHVLASKHSSSKKI